MRRSSVRVRWPLALSVAALVLAASEAPAQDVGVGAGGQADTEYRLAFKADGLFRGEATRDLFNTPDKDRGRAQLRPRLELGVGPVLFGVGGDFNLSTDENTELPPGAALLIRDNYRSRSARLDLAYASVKAGSWIRIQGGRFEMPVALTEMIWDRDLRPQGLSLRVERPAGQKLERLAFTVIGARGSHVFEDGDVDMLHVAGELGLASGAFNHAELVASYLAFRDLTGLEPVIRRQNTRTVPNGPLALDYHVVDLLARLRHEGSVPVQLVAEYGWNTAADAFNKGLWFAAVLGSTRSSRLRGEYTFGHVDKDATVAAYAGDDFLWGTGWTGHRGDLGLRLREGAALHAVGQLQRFKDSPRPAERDIWVKRLRLELRLSR
jgi:putative porin